MAKQKGTQASPVNKYCKERLEASPIGDVMAKAEKDEEDAFCCLSSYQHTL
jgi:hypothetical protein